MKKIVTGILLILSINVFSYEALPTPNHVDVARYAGKWYAVSTLPQFFTSSCIAQIAEYAVINDTTISVLNTCIKKYCNPTNIQGQAVVVDKKTNARLEVTFDNFFTKLFRVKGEYVIIKLSEGYDTALVGSTNRKSLWILSRTQNVEPSVLQDYKKTAKDLGFSIENLVDSKW